MKFTFSGPLGDYSFGVTDSFEELTKIIDILIIKEHICTHINILAKTFWGNHKLIKNSCYYRFFSLDFDFKSMENTILLTLKRQHIPKS